MLKLAAMSRAFDTGVIPAVETRPRFTAMPTLRRGERPAQRPTAFPALVGLLRARLNGERRLAAAFAALLVKHGLDQPVHGGPTRADLEHMRDAVLRRIELVERVIRELGGEPTGKGRRIAAPPSRLEGALADPRAGLGQTLDALAAEALDAADAWMILADLTGEAGRHEAAASFTRAAVESDDQLAAARAWARRLSARPRPSTLS